MTTVTPRVRTINILVLLEKILFFQSETCQSMKLDGNKYDQSTSLAPILVLCFQSLLGQKWPGFRWGVSSIECICFYIFDKSYQFGQYPVVKFQILKRRLF